MENMTQSYYTLADGKSAIDFICLYHLGFFYGNAFKYCVRASRKPGNSAESDINKALVYITSSHNEISVIKRLWMRIYNIFTFSADVQFADEEMSRILRSIILYDDPSSIAARLVKYASKRGINVKPEFEKYGR